MSSKLIRVGGLAFVFGVGIFIMEKEIWKDIPNYEDYYQVSNLGRIKSLFRYVKSNNNNFRPEKEKILLCGVSDKGYKICGLCINGKEKKRPVHQLVAMAFLNHTPNGNKLVIDHINNNKLDNRLENLQVITHRENVSKDIKGCSSKYTGVSFYKRDKKWRSDITINKKLIFLGLFKTELEASCAYQNKLSQISLRKKIDR